MYYKLKVYGLQPWTVERKVFVYSCFVSKKLIKRLCTSRFRTEDYMGHSPATLPTLVVDIVSKMQKDGAKTDKIQVCNRALDRPQHLF